MKNPILSRSLACALSALLAAPALADGTAASQVQSAAANPCAAFDGSANCPGTPAAVPGSTQANKLAQLKLIKEKGTTLDQGQTPPAADAPQKKKASFLSKLVKPALGVAMVGSFAAAGFLAGGPMVGLACLGIGVAVMAGMTLMNCGGAPAK